MQIDNSTLARAMLGVLQRCDASANGSVPFPRLRGVWRGTGLRDSDLRDAVRVLAERNCIRLSDAEGSIAVGITESGRKIASQGLSLDNLRGEVRDRLRLLKARIRPRNEADGRRQRRASD